MAVCTVILTVSVFTAIHMFVLHPWIQLYQCDCDCACHLVALQKEEAQQKEVPLTIKKSIQEQVQ